jgi:hypothetical protein
MVNFYLLRDMIFIIKHVLFWTHSDVPLRILYIRIVEHICKYL